MAFPRGEVFCSFSALCHKEKLQSSDLKYYRKRAHIKLSVWYLTPRQFFRDTFGGKMSTVELLNFNVRKNIRFV